MCACTLCRTCLLMLKVKPACVEFFEHHPRVGDFMSTSICSDARRYMDSEDGDKDAAFSSRCHNGPWRSWCAADLATGEFCSVTLRSMIPRMAEGNNIHQLNSFGPRALRATRLKGPPYQRGATQLEHRWRIIFCTGVLDAFLVEVRYNGQNKADITP